MTKSAPASLYRWVPYPAMSADDLSELAAYPRVLQKLLRVRGVTTRRQAEVFLTQSGSLDDPLDRERGFKNMPRAVRMIWDAVDRHEKIAVYGDYDVDGITASTILVQLLRKIGAVDTISYIPDRFEEGYGLNKEALKALSERGIDLVITVDCGIRSDAEALYAKELGLKLIISDHHEPGETIPEADVVICAKQPGDPYPEKNLAGVGVAYKIAEAVLEARPQVGFEARDWTDIAAIGTVADIVPMTEENRALVKDGLRRLRNQPRYAIQALAETAGFHIADISTQTIGFGIAPRLNAPGRLDKAGLSFELMMSENLSDARSLAAAVDQKNAERKDLTTFIQTKAAESIPKEHIPSVICCRDKDFNMGIVGLGAARISDAYYRPTVIGAFGETETRASARSIEEFSMIEALDEINEKWPGLLKKYGGHWKAAGLTVDNDNWDEFVQRINEIADRKLAGVQLTPVRHYDMELTSAYADLDLVSLLESLEPLGEGNPEPLFVFRDLKVQWAKRIGKDQSHLKVAFACDDGRLIDGIAFGQAEWCEWFKYHDRVDVLCKLEKNTYRDETKLQLQIVDLGTRMT
ncbi:MAG: single-stranded-DNA-specific exonuclease RecJ [Anaerolineaceae bacterium]|nr:single-stranded-DNA-specific exonuclease RecJ [Anaerolineaceae bacterium]